MSGMQLSPFTGSSGVHGIQIGGPEVARFPARRVRPLAFCFRRELATKMPIKKYGALSRPEGQAPSNWDLFPGPNPDLIYHLDRKRRSPRRRAIPRGVLELRYMRSALAGLFGERPDFVFATEGLLRHYLRGASTTVSLKQQFSTSLHAGCAWGTLQFPELSGSGQRHILPPKRGGLHVQTSVLRDMFRTAVRGHSVTGLDPAACWRIWTG